MLGPMDSSPQEDGRSCVSGRVLLEERDFVRAHVAYAKACGAIHKRRAAIATLLAVTSIGVAVGWPVAPGAWCVMVVVALAAFVLAPRTHAIVGRRVFSRLPPARRDVTIDLSDEGYAMRSEKSDARVSWRTFSGWIETEDAFVLHHAAQLANVFPKRAFGDRLDEVRALLDACITGSAEAKERVSNDKKYLRTLVAWLFLVAGAYALYRVVEGH